MAKKLQVNKQAKANNYQHETHLKNLASLQRRIQHVGSKQDRAKNPHDPLSNPVFFFKKGATQEEKTSLESYSKKIVSFK